MTKDTRRRLESAQTEMAGYVLGHINSCKLFHAIPYIYIYTYIYIKFMICKCIVVIY